MRKIKHILLVLICLQALAASAQKYLQLSVKRNGHTRIHRIYMYETIEYKLKGRSFYHRGKMVNVGDSAIILENDSVLMMKDIKAIRYRRDLVPLKMLSAYSARVGIGAFALITANNLILENRPIVNPAAGLVSSLFLAFAYVTHEMQFKSVRSGKNCEMRVVDAGFQHLGPVKE